MELQKGFRIRKGVFIPLCVIYIAVTVMGIVIPEAFASVENAIVNLAAGWFGWLYQLITIVLIVLCVWVLFSKKLGTIRIGGPNAKPIMSRWNWFAISLCGGIATGIVFWGIAEPITHFVDGIPGLVEGGGTRMSALYALSTCYMHWGLPLYAYYCAVGMLIGVCVYNLGQSYNVSSSLYPLLGNRVNGALDRLAKGDWKGAEQYGVRYMQIEPAEENNVMLLMQVYRLQHQFRKAIALYQSLCKRLSDEYGIVPLAETTELYYSILNKWNGAVGEATDDSECLLLGKDAAVRRLMELCGGSRKAAA